MAAIVASAGIGGSSTGGGVVATGQSVHLDAPPTGSGLSAVAANGTTNDRAAVQAALDYVKSTYGGGRVVCPAAKTLKLNTGITIPTKVQLDLNGATLDFTSLGAAVAITVADADFRPLRGGRILGPNTGSGDSFSTTASTGVDISGNGMKFEDLLIERFFRAIDLNNENTFIFQFSNVNIGHCGICVFADFGGSFGGTATGNAGERVAFDNCTMYNSNAILKASGAGAAFFFDACSFDYSGQFFDIAGSHVYYSNCHFETTSGVGDSWSTKTDHLGKMQGTSRLYMSNISIIMGSSVIKIIDSATGPSTYGSGFALFSNCVAFSSGSQKTSRQLISAGAVGATSYTQNSPFVTKWNTIKVAQVTTDGYPARASINPVVSTSNTATAAFTLGFSAVVDAPTWLEVTF